jgi:phage tail sheath protein FI
LLDRGEIVVEIGVAPVEPLEFILLRLVRDGDGTLGLEE